MEDALWLYSGLFLYPADFAAQSVTAQHSKHFFHRKICGNSDDHQQ
jgi:hypothetical protein